MAAVKLHKTIKPSARMPIFNYSIYIEITEYEQNTK